jgi:ribosomal protein S27E
MKNEEEVAVMQANSGVVVRCACCGRASPLEAWRALPTMATLTASTLRDYVSAWPADAVVEVRACAGCGRAIARRTGARRETAA